MDFDQDVVISQLGHWNLSCDSLTWLLNDDCCVVRHFEICRTWNWDLKVVVIVEKRKAVERR